MTTIEGMNRDYQEKLVTIQQRMGIDYPGLITEEALIVALEYECDRNYCAKSRERMGGMGLEFPDTDNLADTLSTGITRRLRNGLVESSSMQYVLKARTEELKNVARVLNLSESELQFLCENYRTGLDKPIEPMGVLQFLTQDYTTRAELLRVSDLLKNAEPSKERIVMTNETISTIQSSGIDVNRYKTVLGIPVVGFGKQTQFFSQTGEALKQLVIDSSTLIMLNVNRPAGQPPDNTYQEAILYSQELKRRGVDCIVVDNTIDGPVRMGDVRSSLFDGFLQVRGTNNVEDVLLAATDDDNIEMPNDWIKQLRNAVGPNTSLIATPVYFDGRGRQANAQSPLFEALEKMRFGIANYRLRQLSDPNYCTQSRDEALKLLFGGEIAGNIEPVILSSFAMRATSYIEVGGYPAIDEITKMIRVLMLNQILKGIPAQIQTITGTVITDNKRQLRAFNEQGLASVAAWKNPNTRFRSDEIDPVRIALAANTQAEMTRTAFEIQLSDVLSFMGLNTSNITIMEISEFLQGAGINTRYVTIEQSGNGFYVRINPMIQDLSELLNKL